MMIELAVTGEGRRKGQLEKVSAAAAAAATVFAFLRCPSDGQLGRWNGKDHARAATIYGASLPKTDKRRPIPVFILDHAFLIILSHATHSFQQ